MSDKNLAYTQRVVCLGLRKMTKDTALIRSGFLYWHKMFADKEFNVDDIVSSVVQYLGVGIDEKKALMLTLHAASNKLFDELPPVPAVLLNMVEGVADQSNIEDYEEVDSDREKIVTSKPARCLVTDAFLHALTAMINKHSSEDLAEIKNILLSEDIEFVRDAADLRAAVRNWVTHGFSGLELPEETTDDDCYDIAHGIYMLMVDVIGPVESDRIVDRAIDETLKIEASTRFNPRKLL